MNRRKTAAILVSLILLNLMPVFFAQQTGSPRSRPGAVIGFLSAAEFPGSDWLARVNAAAAALPNGGTIEVPDSIAGPATTRGAIPSDVTLEFTGSATFGFCQINVAAF